MPPRIYLDHAATTPVRPEAAAAFAEGLARWANPSSPHAEGRAARALLEDARTRIARALGWNGHVVLTGGASEAIALAIGRAKVARIAAGPFEHDAVYRALPLHRPNGGATLHVAHVAGGETGLLQPTPPRDGPWLADCAQTAGKWPLPDADLIVVSGHKLGAPPGIGALLVRDLALLDPMGGQEQGYRGGTENLPGALALAAALEAPRDWLDDAARWRAWLDAEITQAGGQIVGGNAPRVPTVAACRMPGLKAAAQLIRFDMAGIAVSAGSACASGSLKPSRVLLAHGLSEAEAGETIRVSFGWTTTEAEVVRFRDEWVRMKP